MQRVEETMYPLADASRREPQEIRKSKVQRRVCLMNKGFLRRVNVAIFKRVKAYKGGPVLWPQL
jgi:hypothetical protein